MDSIAGRGIGARRVSGHRQAALALHALAPEDCNFILADLPQADQRILRGYLGELAELGFDAVTVDAVLADRAEPTRRDLIDGADANHVLRVLGNEPASLMLALLSAGPWQWEMALLSRLPGHVRVRIETERRAASSPATARDAFVIHAVADALKASGAAKHLEPSTRVPRLQKWIKSWRR